MSDAEFVERFKISSLAPADYNPRKISAESFEELKKSLLRFGVVKPLIVNRNNGILVAGHQRTKAMKAVGIEEAPVILISNTTVHDEIRFNLFHNSVETNKTKVHLSGDIPTGFSTVKSSQIHFEKNLNAAITCEISKLFMKYGQWGSVVIDQDGNILANADYAVCMKLARAELLVYKLPAGEDEAFCVMNGLDYGEYYYDNIGVKSYNQMHCQMKKLGGGLGKGKSSLYEGLVLPRLEKTQRAVDFGAGRCNFAIALNKKGYHILPYEPHLRKDNKDIIDVAGVVAQIVAIQKDIAENGLMDMVILNSVLNSVVSSHFEDMVMTTCNALLGRDGVFIGNCRNLYETERIRNTKVMTKRLSRSIEFLDRDNFSLSFREGVFTMQRFYTRDGLHDMLSRYFHHVEVKGVKQAMLDAVCHGPKQLPEEQYLTALSTEFNMEYPGDIRHNQHHNLIKEILAHVSNRSNH